MDRQSIEEFSKKLTVEYGEMIQEMFSDTVSDKLEISRDIQEYYYINICGLSSKWIPEGKNIYDYMFNLFVGAHSLYCPVSIVFKHEDDKLNLYIGTKINYIESIIGLIKGTFSNVIIKENSNTDNYSVLQFDRVYNSQKYRFGGYIKGNPSLSDLNGKSPLAVTIDGMAGKDWCFSIFAHPIKKNITSIRHELWMIKLSQCSDLQKVSFSENYAEESISYEKSYQQSRQYCDLINEFVEKINMSLIYGEWDVSVNYSTINQLDADLMGALLVSSFYGDDSLPENIHKIRCDSGNVVFPSGKYNHRHYNKQMDYPKYSNYVSSMELGVYAAFPDREVYGLSIHEYIDYGIDRIDNGNLELGNIVSSDCITKNIYKPIYLNYKLNVLLLLRFKKVNSYLYDSHYFICFHLRHYCSLSIWLKYRYL